MGEYGIKIKNIKAGTLYGYNKGLRTRYDYTDAMLSNSLFSLYMSKNGMNIYKGESTRDIICLEFNFGSRSYDEEIKHLKEILGSSSDNSKDKIQKIINLIETNKDNCIKKKKEEIREEFYQNGVEVEYKTLNKHGEVKKIDKIHYKMLFRTPSKAKIGQVMFINEKLYSKAYDWLTMGLGKKMDRKNAKIVEMSAYAPLTTSTIIDTIHIPVENILILDDQDSFFETITKIVKAEDYKATKRVIDEEKTEINKQRALENGKLDDDGDPIYKRSFKKIETTEKKCVVEEKISKVKNTIWDGMGLIESDFLPDYINGMALLRNHFFKMCGFRGHLQLFFKDWCEKNGHDYNEYIVYDMFGLPHLLKDIKVITTNNSIKWLKFKDLMGNSDLEAYQYWRNRINVDGSIFGIVKTDHESKLGDVQQMSYQMINTLPCKKEDVQDIAKTSVEFVELLKQDNDEFEKFLRKNANEINHYEMLADLYKHNNNFGNSEWFRLEKRKIINNYVTKLRKGKIAVDADNLTICGNPYALLLYSVGEDWSKDPTLNHEVGAIQCYTTRFSDNEYLCAFRNPHNSPNNILYLHNVYSEEMKKYFPFSDNILAINCIKSDIQDRANGCDEDSDFFFGTNQNTLVEYARICYESYPTIVNKLKESNITYENTKLSYADMDNKFAKSRMSIGESSNLAQLAMTYYWTNPGNKELYDNFVILSVLAQVAIDSCKREYEVDPITEIERIKKMECMNLTKEIWDGEKNIKIKHDLPEFMKYTKEVKLTKNGVEIPYEEIKESKDKIRRRINKSLICPMNWLQDVINNIQMSSNENSTPTEDFFNKINGKANSRSMNKIKKIIVDYDDFVSENIKHIEENDQAYDLIVEKTNEVILQIRKMNIKNAITINRLIETSLEIEKNNNKESTKKFNNKYTRKILNILYKVDRDKFLNNFKKN